MYGDHLWGYTYGHLWGLGKVKDWFAFHLEGTSINSDPDLPEQTLSELNDPEKAQDIIEDMTKKGYSVMHVLHQDGLPFMDEMNTAIVKHYEAWEQTQEKHES